MTKLTHSVLFSIFCIANTAFYFQISSLRQAWCGVWLLWRQSYWLSLVLKIHQANVSCVGHSNSVKMSLYNNWIFYIVIITALVIIRVVEPQRKLINVCELWYSLSLCWQRFKILNETNMNGKLKKPNCILRGLSLPGVIFLLWDHQPGIYYSKHIWNLLLIQFTHENCCCPG